jgi:hypothetical protein
MTTKSKAVKTFEQKTGMTPVEMIRKLDLKKPCDLCGDPPVMRMRVLAEMAEMEKREPDIIAKIKLTNPNGLYVPTIDTKFGKMMLLHDMRFCEGCRVGAQRQAAKYPSWMIVEFDEAGRDASHKLVIQSAGVGT